MHVESTRMAGPAHDAQLLKHPDSIHPRSERNRRISSTANQEPKNDDTIYGKISFTLSRTCWLREGFKYLIVDSISE